MKKILCLFIFSLFSNAIFSQELLANVTVNYSQIGGSNVQVFKTLEKSLRDFINNTSWTGKKLQNFEKIKCSFSIIISKRPTNNTFEGSIVVQSLRPVFNSTYDSPVVNINDTKFAFEYLENENLIFNERQFSGKNLTDVIGFYIYIILGYDMDTFQNLGGKIWFEKALKISQNSQSQNYLGWSTIESTRTRGYLIDNIIKEDNNTLRNVYYLYHRNGLDLMSGPNVLMAKKNIETALMRLKVYQNNFQLNYPFNVFIEAKKGEIFNIFNKNNNANINMVDLKALMSGFDPKDNDLYWDKWK